VVVVALGTLFLVHDDTSPVAAGLRGSGFVVMMFVGHDFGWNVKLCVKKVKGRGICGQVLEIEMDGGLLGEKKQGEKQGTGEKRGEKGNTIKLDSVGNQNAVR